MVPAEPGSPGKGPLNGCVCTVRQKLQILKIQDGGRTIHMRDPFCIIMRSIFKMAAARPLRILKSKFSTAVHFRDRDVDSRGPRNRVLGSGPDPPTKWALLRAITVHARPRTILSTSFARGQIPLHLDAVVPATPNPGSRTWPRPAIDHYGAVSTFHDDNIRETRFSMLCTSCLELTTANCSH